MGEEAKVTLTILARNLAKQELESFRTSIRELGKEAKALLSSSLTQAIGLGALAVALRKAFQATDELEQSQRTLAATAQITGTNLQELYSISNSLKDAFKLDDDLANQFTETITRLTVQAGDFNKTQQAAAAFLELGAARGFTAKETMESLETAFIGVYRGAQRLIGQNVGDLFERQARKIGLTVAELTESEKAHILLTAAISAGETARGSYAQWLETAAGQQQLFALRLNDAQVRLGKALAPIRLLAIQGFAFIAEKVEAFIGGLQLLAAEFGAFTTKLPAIGLGIKAWVIDLFASIAEFLRDNFPKLYKFMFNIPPEELRAAADKMREDAKRIGDAAAEGLREARAEVVAEHNAPPAPRAGGPAPGSAAPPAGVPDTRIIKELTRDMIALKAEFRDGLQGAVQFAGGLDDIRNKARAALKEGGLSPEAMQGLQGIIDQTTAAIKEAADAVNKLVDVSLEADLAWQALINTTIKWKDILTDVTSNTLNEFGTVVEDVFSAMVDSSVQAGVALQVGMLKAIAAIIRGIGQMLLVEAGQWIAEGIANPLVAGIKFAGAAKAIGVAGLAFALAGALGGAANNTSVNLPQGSVPGGTAGSTPASTAQTAQENKPEAVGTLVIEGGILDMTDPRQADAFQNAIVKLTNLKRIDVIVRPFTR